MSRSLLARTALVLTLLAAGSTGAAAWWERYNRDIYGPPPIYVYVPAEGPTWTSNGWSYPSVGYLVPAPPGPYVIPGYQSGYFAGPPRFRAPYVPLK